MKPKNKHLNLLIIGLLFVMGIVISPMTAQAEEITDSVNGVISFEEYYTTLRSEYKKEASTSPSLTQTLRRLIRRSSSKKRSLRSARNPSGK